jgi:hypothetical protein
LTKLAAAEQKLGGFTRTNDGQLAHGEERSGHLGLAIIFEPEADCVAGDEVVPSAMSVVTSELH